MKKRISLTERDLHRIIRGVINEYEDITYRQLVNLLGPDIVDDEWNAAAECEDREDFEDKLWHDIADNLCDGNHPRDTVINFRDLKNFLAKEYNMSYIGSDDKMGSHDFKFNFNGNETILCIIPRIYYPKQAEMRLDNTMIIDAILY